MSRSFRLCADIAAMAPPSLRAGDGPLSDALEARLGASLSSGLHEVFADEVAETAGVGFALMLSLRRRPAGLIVWVSDQTRDRHCRLYGWGLVELGCDPAQLLIVHADGVVAQLRAARDAMACPAVAAVVMPSRGRVPTLDLTATRRLHLAAAGADVLAVSLRLAAQPAPSAALTRWQVDAAPSRPLAGQAPGPPRLALRLLRRRGGVSDWDMLVEWDRERCAFILPQAHPGRRPAVVPGRTAAAPVAIRGRHAA